MYVQQRLRRQPIQSIHSFVELIDDHLPTIWFKQYLVPLALRIGSKHNVTMQRSKQDLSTPMVVLLEGQSGNGVLKGFHVLTCQRGQVHLGV